MKPAIITVVIPVFGRAALLKEAWQSLKLQTDSHWHLLIADDGSDDDTAAWISSDPALDSRTTWLRRPQNLGLFANLNDAINCINDTGWVLLLCSDDRLLPNAIATVRHLQQKWPEAPWILSTHLSIGTKGEPLVNTSAIDHCQFALTTCTFKAEEFIPLLLRYGSINGNLSGMAFSLQLWLEAGEFRADWSHAADWEWLIRASEKARVLLNREPIAEIRIHPAQLSNSNRLAGNDLFEIAAVQSLLLSHPLLAHEPHRLKWACHHMQFHLWNLIKRLIQFRWRGIVKSLIDIHRTVGLIPCMLAFLSFLPIRVINYVRLL